MPTYPKSTKSIIIDSLEELSREVDEADTNQTHLQEAAKGDANKVAELANIDEDVSEICAEQAELARAALSRGVIFSSLLEEVCELRARARSARAKTMQALGEAELELN